MRQKTVIKSYCFDMLFFQTLLLLFLCSSVGKDKTVEFQCHLKRDVEGRQKREVEDNGVLYTIKDYRSPAPQLPSFDLNCAGVGALMTSYRSRFHCSVIRVEKAAFLLFSRKGRKNNFLQCPHSPLSDARLKKKGS